MRARRELAGRCVNKTQAQVHRPGPNSGSAAFSFSRGKDPSTASESERCFPKPNNRRPDLRIAASPVAAVTCCANTVRLVRPAENDFAGESLPAFLERVDVDACG